MSTENNNENNTQELELWERMSTTEGAERAPIEEIFNISVAESDEDAEENAEEELV